VSDSKKEFLTFVIGAEEFAVEILRVQEIRGWEQPNPLPSVPPYIKGVVDLRGIIVPIIDLREKFSLKTSYDNTTVVIVVHVFTSQGERVVGLVVDAVSDVHLFDMKDLQPPPDISSSLQSQYVLGLSTIKEGQGQGAGYQTQSAESNPKQDRMVILVDIDKLASEGLIDDVVNQAQGHMPTGNG